MQQRLLDLFLDLIRLMETVLFGLRKEEPKNHKRQIQNFRTSKLHLTVLSRYVCLVWKRCEIFNFPEEGRGQPKLRVTTKLLSVQPDI